MRRRLLARAGAAAIALTTVGLAPVRAASPVRGIFNWIHSTGDAERAFAFYHDVFGVELSRSPFAGSATAAPEPIRPAAQAGSDPLVWDLTNTHGSRFRTVFMRASNTPFGSSCRSSSTSRGAIERPPLGIPARRLSSSLSVTSVPSRAG
jgi:hypothetical protein